MVFVADRTLLNARLAVIGRDPPRLIKSEISDAKGITTLIKQIERTFVSKSDS